MFTFLVLSTQLHSNEQGASTSNGKLCIRLEIKLLDPNTRSLGSRSADIDDDFSSKNISGAEKPLMACFFEDAGGKKMVPTVLIARQSLLHGLIHGLENPFKASKFCRPSHVRPLRFRRHYTSLFDTPYDCSFVLIRMLPPP